MEIVEPGVPTIIPQNYHPGHFLIAQVYRRGIDGITVFILELEGNAEEALQLR